MPPEQSTTQTEQEYQKLSLKEFFSITKWAISSLFKVNPWLTSIHIFLSIIFQYWDLVTSYLMAKIIDALIRLAKTPTSDLKELYSLVYILIAFNIIESVIRWIIDVSRSTLRLNQAPIMRQAFYTKLHNLGVQTLEVPEVNDSIMRADRYINGLMQFYQQSINFVGEVLKLISLLIIVSKFSPQFVGILILAYIPYYFFDKTMRTKSYKFDWDTTEKSRIAGSYSGSLSSVDSLKEIFITNGFKFLDKKYMDFRLWQNKVQLKMSLVSRTGGSVFGLFIQIVMVSLGYLNAFSKVVKGVITVGDATFWIRTFGNLSGSLNRVISNSNDLFEHALYFKEAAKVFAMEPAFADGKTVFTKMEQGPHIKMANISFKYPNAEKYSIENLNLEVKSGEKIAIVGHNGAGKTTLIKLLCRFYQPTQGKILINDIDLKDVKIDSFYRNLGVLFQDYNRYTHMTVKDNIHMGMAEKEIDEVAVRIAAFSADAIDFVEAMPKKFDQYLSEKIKGGIRLSTGQWQKIAMARFFYRDAPLVIFDEPTAAIDPVSEYTIFNKIYEFFKGKTVIIISHRFSTVRNADRIIVMDKGQVVEQGSHNELMDLNGYYAKAFNLQAEGYK